MSKILGKLQPGKFLVSRLTMNFQIFCSGLRETVKVASPRNSSEAVTGHLFRKSVRILQVKHKS